ncbi:hypothetical protein, partial [Lactococcus petauri]|uniref:hypothetical protein n=1 Tax=Lactococcus petauri TaxID=1940789 RepID=UPI0021F1DC29
RRRFAQHEALFPGAEVSINVCLPDEISDDDFIRFQSKAGQYRGLSPWGPGEFGFYEVVSLRPRQLPQFNDLGAETCNPS